SSVRAALRHQIQQTHLAMADLMAGLISGYVTDIEGDAGDLADREGVKTAIEQNDFDALDTVLAMWQSQRQRLIYGVNIYSLDGIPLASGHTDHSTPNVQGTNEAIVREVVATGSARLGQPI